MDRSERESRRGVRVDSPHAHVLGIDSRGMSGLAQNLVQKGMSVTGTETIPGAAWKGLSQVGIKIDTKTVALPFSLTKRTQLLVHGPEVGREHPVRLRALKRGILQETPEGWLARHMTGRLGVVSSGNRDATLAAALTGFVLAQAGLEPSVILETPAQQLGGWSREGSGPHVVAEWSGAPEAFEGFRARITMLMNVGSDPWVDREVWAEAIRRSLQFAPAGGTILALGHPSLLELSTGSVGVPERFEWLSLQRGADWWGTDLREESGRFRFRVFYRGRYVLELKLSIHGRRSVVAALATVAACDHLGVPIKIVREALEDFSGLSRDFESRGSYRGVTLVDDACDDASSIRETLSVARRAFGNRRLWAAYATPARGEVRRLVPAFSSADRVLITDRDQAIGSSERSSRFLTQALASSGIKTIRAGSLIEAISELDRNLEPGDVLLTLGAGDVGTIADAFIRRLPRDRQGR